MTQSIIPLGELFKIGSSKRVLKSQWKDKGVPFYRGREITRLASDGFVENELFISEDDYAEYSTKYGVPVPGDIVITAIGTIGNSYVVKKGDRFYFKDASVLWLQKKREAVSSKFVNLWLKSPQFIEQLDKGNGATVDTLTIRKLKGVLVDLPPLPEQKRIVATLDEVFEGIDAAIANAEKNLENARELFESHLKNIFTQKGEGWRTKTLGKVGKVSMCKRILKKQTTTSGDIPFYKIGTFGKEPNAFISNAIYQEFKEKYSFPKKGDVLISASGTIGRRVIYDGIPAYFQDSNIVWIDNNEELVLNEYLNHFYEVCDWNPSKGATISRLYNDDLKRIKISFPSIAEQKKLIEIMVELNSQTQKLEAIYQNRLSDLVELKQSLLQKAFAGKLTNKPEQASKKAIA